MSDFAARIKKLRLERGMTQEEFADLLGTSKQNISRYESGDVSPKITTANSIAQKLGVSLSYLNGDDDTAPERPLPANLKPLSSLHRQKVPLIGKVAAGVPIMAEQDYETYVDAPVGCDCALEVEGDSMVPTYQPGDIVYIKTQPVANEGAVAVVIIDDSAALKHVYHMGATLVLTSDNQEYAPIRLEPGEHEYVAIYGIPVGYTRIYRKNPLKNVRKGFKKD